MFNRPTLAGAVLAIATAIAAPASAAQIIPLEFSTPDPDGYIFASAGFDWPVEGTWAFAQIDFSGLELIDVTLTGYVDGAATWWDSAIGGVTGNEYFLAFDCGSVDGCMSPVTPTKWVGRIETPRGFDKPCGPETIGDCSFHYTPQMGVADAYFRVISPGGSYQATLTISDFSAVPEASTWALLITGFATIGGALRARRRSLAF